MTIATKARRTCSAVEIDSVGAAEKSGNSTCVGVEANRSEASTIHAGGGAEEVELGASCVAEAASSDEVRFRFGRAIDVGWRGGGCCYQSESRVVAKEEGARARRQV